MRYADDAVLIPETTKDVLELNGKKTDVMAVSRSNERTKINMFTNGKKLKQRHQFKNVGTIISSDGRIYSEIASRIVQAKKKKNFQRIKSITTSQFTQEEEP